MFNLYLIHHLSRTSHLARKVNPFESATFKPVRKKGNDEKLQPVHQTKRNQIYALRENQ